MLEKKYDFNGRIYSIVPCVKEDIPSHTERVLSYWKETDTPIKLQLKLLEADIEADTAYKVIDDTGKSMAGMYLKWANSYNAICHYMFLENKRMLAILFYYVRKSLTLRYIQFKPHSKTFIPFKFLVTEGSIRLFRDLDEPITIDVIGRKSQILYEDHYLRYGIKELD